MKPFKDEPWRRNNIQREAKIKDKPSSLPAPEPFMEFGIWPFTKPNPKDETYFITLILNQRVDLDVLEKHISDISPCMVSWVFSRESIVITFEKRQRYQDIVSLVKPIVIGLIE